MSSSTSSSSSKKSFRSSSSSWKRTPTTKLRKKIQIKKDSLSPTPTICLPSGAFHFTWNSILCIILIYSIIETPYTISFITHPQITFSRFGLVIDLILVIDIIINFRTAYVDKYDRLRIIRVPKLIAIHYSKTWLAVDVMAMIPFEFLYNIVSFFRFLRILKLLRLLKILKIFKLFTEQYVLSHKKRNILRLCNTIGLMLLTAHYCACIWYAVGWYGYNNNMNSWIDYMLEFDGNEEQDIDLIPGHIKYSHSVYWSVVTLFTTGYGDIHAFNIYEQWASIFCILIGSLLFAYFIGVLTQFSREDRISSHEEQNVEESLLFCTHYGLPKELSRAIITHIRYYARYNYIFKHQNLIDSLPNYLQKTVATHLARTILNGVDIFRDLPISLIGQIALKLKSKSCNIGHKLYEIGDIGKQIYIQRTGESKLLLNGSITNIIKLKRGDVFGEFCILSRTRMHSVQCSTWSEFYILSMLDIIDLLNDNYETHIAKNQWNNIKDIVRLSLHHPWELPRSVNFKSFADRSFGTQFECGKYGIIDNIDNIDKFDRKLRRNKMETLNNKNLDKSFQTINNYRLKLHSTLSERRDKRITDNRHKKNQSDIVIGLPQYDIDNWSVNDSCSYDKGTPRKAKGSGGVCLKICHGITQICHGRKKDVTYTPSKTSFAYTPTTRILKGTILELEESSSATSSTPLQSPSDTNTNSISKISKSTVQTK